MVELMVGLLILMILGGVFAAFLANVLQGTARENARGLSISGGRNGIDFAASTLRTRFVQFNNAAGTPLGVNFDLDDDAGDPLVRDAILFFVDENDTALLYSPDETGTPATAGFDDTLGDGSPDVIAIGLVRQDDDEDGVQDFVDLDFDGKEDDLDGDGKGDLLWQFATVRFDSADLVETPVAWDSAQALAKNVLIQYIQGNQDRASNIDTLQFFAKNPAAMASDKNGDGIVDESELGSIDSGGGEIDTETELAAIDGIIINLHVASVRGNQRDEAFAVENITSQVVPRSIGLYRMNGIIGLADPAESKNVN